MANYDTGYGGYETGGGGEYAGGGGGFLASPQKSGGGGGRDQPQTVTPLTIRMILSSVQNPSDDSLLIDNKQVQKVVVYGKVREAVGKYTNTEYLVDDSTGVIKVIQHMPDDNQPGQPTAVVGSYVYINGAIRSMEGERTILAHHVRAVVDHNELTTHFLSVVFVHYQNLKGSLNDGQKLQNRHTSSFGAGAAGGGGGGGGGFGGFVVDNPIQYQQQQQDGGGEHSDWKLVHDCFAADVSTDSGLNVNQVAQQLAGRGFTVQKVRQICDSLMNDGYVYSTIDDNHFKSTGSFM